MESKLKKFSIYLALSGIAFLMVFPFLWTILSSFKPPHEIICIPPTFWPKDFTFDNYKEILKAAHFGRWYLNSLVVAGVVTVSVCFFSSLAGYSLAKFEYPYRNTIFYLILSTMMVPMQMLVIPWYILAIHFKLCDTYLGLIIPGLISAFGIFLMKQFMEGIPNSLIEAARLDGAGEITIFTRIILPLVKPSMAALAIFTFTGNWDSFLWPLIMTNSEVMKTLPVGLNGFAGQYGIEYHIIMAAANLVVIPSIVVFIAMQKQIIQGITLSGLKG
ncbi:MAG: carbohydrate ABC transporter permease [Candidatus Wallbacteria bacterium]|nr:carbohydrate ABC transporter permease [Candidatus Wallbacteria bacterium]